MTITRTLGAIAASALIAATAAACGTEAEAGATQADTVTVADPWVKAATTEEGMTAAFGTLSNASDEDVTVVSVTTDVTDIAELHEMATDDDGQMVMREKEGGIVVPAGGSHELSPGGDHLMLLDLPAAIEPGQDVRITLTFSDDSTMSFTAPARSFAGANEDYDPEDDDGSGQGGHEDHDHGDHDHGEGDHADHDH